MNKKWTKKNSTQENWSKEETQKHHHEQGEKALRKAKEIEQDGEYERVPIFPRGFKFVKIKK